MCGIVGTINRRKVNDGRLIQKMMEVQVHRGPDDMGICAYSFEQGEIDSICQETRHDEYMGWIGFNRLSIRDLSMTGHQPMVNDRKNMALVFNGEVYNADFYRNELTKMGHAFAGTSDTEVVLKMYEEYGIEDTLKRLNGMFSIVIVDTDKKNVFLARDRYGIKPMYYWKKNDRMVFASELKSIIQDENIPRKIDVKTLSMYLAFNSNCNKVLMEGIKQVEPGTYLTVSENLDIQEHMYWNANEYDRHAQRIDIDNDLNNAVKSQLVSDVKVGCQLSGGVDSSLVTYYSHLNGNALNDTISIVFDDPRYSEEKYIDEVNKRFSLNSHKKVLDAEYVLNNWKKAVWHLDTIPLHPNSIGILQLAEEANNWVTVLLSGEGADELWGGYGEYSQSLLVNIYLKLRKCGIRVKKFDEKYFIDDKICFDSYLVNVHKANDFNLCKAVCPKFDVTEEIEERKKYAKGLRGTFFDKMVKYNIRFYLPEVLNRQDKMSMAKSIENRVPFLDNHLVDMALSIPRKNLLGVKYIKGTNLRGMLQGKIIIKSVCEKIFGMDFTYRDKCGFSIPLKEYLLSDIFKDYIEKEIFPKMDEHKLFDEEKVKALFYNLKNESDKKAELLWRVFSTELWCQLFVDNGK